MMLPRQSAASTANSFLYIAITLIVLLRVEVLALCPHRCTCHDDTEGIRVDCRARAIDKMADIAYELPAETVVLDVGENAISVVDETSFPVLERLRVVRMDGCQVERIESHAFRNVRRSLELVDLSQNSIESVHQDAFVDLHSLRLLRLNVNRLREGLPDFVFRGLVLDELHLDANNMTLLSDALFNGTRVSVLSLDENRLPAISAAYFRPLRDSLRSLSISRNQIPLVISSDAFSGFIFTNLTLASSGLTGIKFIENVDSVEALDVGGNPLGSISLSWDSALALNCHEARLNNIGLSSLDAAMMSSFRSARFLDLSGNKLQGTLDPYVFRNVPDLRHLDLSFNAIDRLPDGFISHLSHLETMNVSGNALTSIDHRVLTPSDQLKTLDLSGNRIQIFSESLESVFDGLDVVELGGNPFHCNCEMLWFRRWTARTSRSWNKEVRCSSPPQSSSLPLLNISESSMTCQKPTVRSITESVSITENSDVMLSCTAEGDPAPQVRWTSPSSEVFSVSPPSDRTQYRVTAFWQTRRIQRQQAGWYVCVAENLAGSQTRYTYVHVGAVGEPPVDLSNLTYPDTASASTAKAVEVTVPSHQSVVMGSSVNTTVGRTAAHRSTAATRTFGDVWVTTGRTLSNGTSGANVVVDPDSDDSDVWKIVILAVAIGVGVCLLIAIVSAVIVVCVRRHKKRSEKCRQRPLPIREDRIRHPAPIPGISLAPGECGSPTNGNSGRWDPMMYGREQEDLLPTGDGRLNGDGTSESSSSREQVSDGLQTFRGRTKHHDRKQLEPLYATVDDSSPTTS